MELTARSPGLRLLLQLQDDILALVVVLEEVDVVDDQDQRLLTTLCTPQSNLFQFIESCEEKATTSENS